MSSQQAAAQAAMETYFEAEWSAFHPRSTVSFSETGYRPEAGVAVWCRLTIIFGRGNLATAGGHSEGGANIVPVVVTAAIFAAAGKGLGAINRATDIVRDALNRVRIGNVQLMAAGMGELVEDDEDKAWVQMRVVTPGEFEDWL